MGLLAPHPGRCEATVALGESILEGFDIAGPADEHHRLSFPRADVATHARRVGRHPREGQPDRIRAIAQKALDRTDGHVALDDIAIDQRRVARAEAVGNS